MRARADDSTLFDAYSEAVTRAVEASPPPSSGIDARGAGGCATAGCRLTTAD